MADLWRGGITQRTRILVYTVSSDDIAVEDCFNGLFLRLFTEREMDAMTFTTPPVDCVERRDLMICYVLEYDFIGLSFSN